jgi:hypothetical protein
MYVETPSGNLLSDSWARTVAGSARRVSDERDAPDWLLILVSLALMGLAALFLYGALAWLFEFIKTEYEAQSVWAYGTAMAIALLLGRGAYYLREVRPKWWIYPPIEIGVGLGLTALAIKPGLETTLNILVFLGAVRVIVDGITRFRNFRSEADALIAKAGSA